jgi:DNA-binding MarR family transcriptional regulator
MRDTGLQATQYSILAMLSDGERLSISELADDLGLERTSMSRTLRPMEREGLVAHSLKLFVTVLHQSFLRFKFRSIS